MTVVCLDVWQPAPGHRAQLDELLGCMRRIHERLGTRVSLWCPVSGTAPPGCIVYSTEFDDMDAYTAITQRIRSDREFRQINALLSPLADAIADLISNVVAVEID